MTRAASLVASALILALAAMQALARTVPESLTMALRAAPLVVFGGGTLLGLLIRRGRLVLGLIVLALADRALVHFSSRPVFDAVALLLPLNLGVLAWLAEASLLTGRGALRLSVIVVSQVAAVVMLERPELAAIAGALGQPLVAHDLSTWIALPQPALVAFAMALGLLMMRFSGDALPLAAGAAGALAASFLALDGASTGKPASVYFVAAGALLLIGAAREPTHVGRPDEVTGLPMRLAFTAALRRLRGRYVLACVEIDEFRRFREEHGADAARRMLRLVAKALTKVGGGGRAYFLEGHAFAVLFRRTSAEAAVRHLNVVRRAVESATLDVQTVERPRAGQPGRGVGKRRATVSVTISAGAAEPRGRDANPHAVLKTAEQALARAKQDGQNRVSV